MSGDGQYDAQKGEFQQDFEGYNYNPSNIFGSGSQYQGIAQGLQKQAEQPEFIESAIVDKAYAYNAGFMYLGGLTVGGAYGVVEGIRTAPSNKFKIRMNSIMNKAGRRGPRLGNALGVLAVMFSASQFTVDKLTTSYIDTHVPDWFVPTAAATLTGMLYKSTLGSKTMILAGALGGTCALGAAGVKSVAPELVPRGLLFF